MTLRDPPPRGRLRDEQGRFVELGDELGRGGEGAVFALPDRPGTVAKLYHEPPDEPRARKLVAMAALSTDALSRVAAWPSGYLRRDGAVAGFLMPRVDGHKNVHLLYGPRSRAKEFPAASYAFLVRAAANLARAFAVVHEHGHVVGDVNDKIAMVSPQATVTLVDCDSFQVRHEGALLPCDVGVPTHQPPELQHVTSFRGLERTARHDTFGLAVAVFQLLFLARHPFSGAFLGEGEMSIERAIRESRFVYGAGAEAAQMRPPPFSLPLSAVGLRVTSLFERAFARPAAERPTASEWVDALEAMERALQSCARNPLHQRLDAKRECPLCELESAAQVSLFGQSPPTLVPTTTQNLAELWAEVERVEFPPRPPFLPRPEKSTTWSALGHELAAAKEHRTFLRSGLVVAALGTAALGLAYAAPYLDAVALGVLVAFWNATGIRGTRPWQQASRNFTAVDERWQKVSRGWEARTSDEAFRRARAELLSAKEAVEALADEEAERIRKINHDSRDAQLDRFLDGLPLANASIAGLDTSQIALLQSRGVRTARDVTTRTVVPGGGLTVEAAEKVHAWRKRMAAAFRYDPSRPADLTAIAAVRRDVAVRRMRLLAQLAAGPAGLRTLAKELEERRRTALEEAREVAEDLSRARGDLHGV